MNTAKTARRANLPRTTVVFALSRLVQQGIVSKLRISKHWEWTVDKEEVNKKLLLLSKTIEGTDTFEKDNSIRVRIGRGIEEIIIAASSMSRGNTLWYKGFVPVWLQTQVERTRSLIKKKVNHGAAMFEIDCVFHGCDMFVFDSGVIVLMDHATEHILVVSEGQGLLGALHSIAVKAVR